MYISILTVTSAAILSAVAANPVPPSGAPPLSQVGASSIPTDTPIPVTEPSLSSAIAAAMPTTTALTTAPSLNKSPYPAFNASQYPSHNFTHGTHNRTHPYTKNCTDNLTIAYTNGTQTFNATIYPYSSPNCSHSRNETSHAGYEIHPTPGSPYGPTATNAQTHGLPNEGASTNGRKLFNAGPHGRGPERVKCESMGAGICGDAKVRRGEGGKGDGKGDVGNMAIPGYVKALQGGPPV